MLDIDKNGGICDRNKYQDTHPPISSGQLAYMHYNYRKNPLPCHSPSYCFRNLRTKPEFPLVHYIQGKLSCTIPPLFSSASLVYAPYSSICKRVLDCFSGINYLLNVMNKSQMIKHTRINKAATPLQPMG